MKKTKLSIIVPCYNEEANLNKGVLEEMYQYLKSKKFDWEVLVSDDGSTDNSRQVIKKKLSKLKGFKLLENPHGGKPLALLYGIKKASGDLVLFTDMDQSTPIGEYGKLSKYIDDFSVVIGSRGVVRRNFPIYRKVGAFAFMFIRRFLILPEIIDTQCGFKLFRSNVIKKAFPRLEYFNQEIDRSGWKVSSYDVELLYILKKMGEKIKEVKVKWNDRDISKSKGGALSKYFRESKEMIVQILRVKMNGFKGIY